jgi:hypothetical protein
VAVARALAKEILRYFLTHPEATDDLDGISRWRLEQAALERSVSDTYDALQWLVEQGYLAQEQLHGTRLTFRMNSKKRDAAKQFLGEDE